MGTTRESGPGFTTDANRHQRRRGLAARRSATRGRGPLLARAGNALLLNQTIEHWFDTYHLVVVPVDPLGQQITRWKTDVVSAAIGETDPSSRI